MAVADTQPLFLDGMRAAIESAPALELTFIATTPAELVWGVRSTTADVAVVGLSHSVVADPWLAAVASPDRATELLVLMETVDEDRLSAALSAGARGVASRNVGATEPVAAVEGIASGRDVFEHSSAGAPGRPHAPGGQAAGTSADGA